MWTWDRSYGPEDRHGADWLEFDGQPGGCVDGHVTDLLMAAETAGALGRYWPGADIEIENLWNLTGGDELGGGALGGHHFGLGYIWGTRETGGRSGTASPAPLTAGEASCVGRVLVG